MRGTRPLCTAFRICELNTSIAFRQALKQLLMPSTQPHRCKHLLVCGRKGTAHGVRLSAARLAVRQDCAIEAFQDVLDDRHAHGCGRPERKRSDCLYGQLPEGTPALCGRTQGQQPIS